MLSQRLKSLRLARGLSLDTLAAQMGGVVTKQALSKYEQGKARPSPVVLNKLAAALGVKAAYLWSDPTVVVEFVAYRKGSTLPLSEQHRVESLVAEQLEARVRLQDLLGQTDEVTLPVQVFDVSGIEDAEAAAITLRTQWNLGVDPIANVIDVLEHHFIHVVDIEAGEKFDGISAIVRDQEQHMRAAAVVTRKGIAGERQRLDLAHELGHLSLKIREGDDPERAAFRFGAAFLAPAPVILQEVGVHRGFIQLEELLLLKRRFGMSLQALLYRLHDLGVITDSYYRQWCIDINRFGWRKREPFEMPPEQPQWMRQAALRALAEGLIGKEEAESMVGDRIAAEVPLSVVERRAFMGLPLEERRRLLAEQAAKLTDHYAQATDWQEVGEGDFVEY